MDTNNQKEDEIWFSIYDTVNKVAYRITFNEENEAIAEELCGASGAL